MDQGSSPAAGANLSGVRKTLRRLYTPSCAPHEAIDQVLARLASLDQTESRPTLLAPAA